MKRSLNITYRWWRADKEPIPQKHIEQLEETAWERINKQITNGYSSGELSCYVWDNNQTDTHYSGWWELKTSEF